MHRKKWGLHKRSEDENQRIKFADWVDLIGIEKSWIGRTFLSIESRFQFQKTAYLLLFCFLLSLAITFEVHTPNNYKVGDVSQSDVVSPMSFELTDEASTKQRKLKAEAEVPVLMDYNPGMFDNVSDKVYEAFRIMRQKMKSQGWTGQGEPSEESLKDFLIFKEEFTKALGVDVPNYIFEWLAQRKFSANIENTIIKNLEVWYAQKIAENVDKLIPRGQTGVVARSIGKSKTQNEFTLRKGEIVDSSLLDFFNLEFDSKYQFSQKDKTSIVHLAHLLIVPNLTLNKQEMNIRHQAARDSVPSVVISVKKNQVVLSEGAVVEPVHVAILNKIENMRYDKKELLNIFLLTLIFFSLILVFFQYLRRFSLGKVKVENKDIIVMGLVTLSMVLMTKFFLFLTQTAFATKFGSFLPNSVYLYSAPVAAAPMLVGLLIMSGEVVWLFTAFLSVVMAIMAEMNFAFMIVTFAGGIAAARGVFACKKRNDIYRAGVRTGAVNSLVIALLFVLMKQDQEGSLNEILITIPAGFFAGILSSMITLMIIPILEALFNYTTDVKLLELSNLNHPLLKEMIVKAPGTYHHSMMVGSMVEAAAEEIGANPLLGKVMCYYHDIGKMEHANYFIENQKQGNNPHDHISPYMSKTLLVAHVKDGVELGMSHKLGKPIIDGIIQHHGTTLISYFYNKAIDLKDDHNENEVQEEEFRYPGPKPQFREAALCMLADSIEAAARSLDEPTPTRLQNIVKNIVQRKFMDGQLDECNLTLKDLSKVENAFIRILLGIYHQRIDYPKNAGGGAAEAPKSSFFVVGKGN